MNHTYAVSPWHIQCNRHTLGMVCDENQVCKYTVLLRRIFTGGWRGENNPVQLFACCLYLLMNNIVCGDSFTLDHSCYTGASPWVFQHHAGAPKQ